MFASARSFARLLLLGAIGFVTLGAEYRCSNIDGPEAGKGTHVGPTFAVTLALKDSSGSVTGRFARGELITFELTVLNRTNAPIRLQLPTQGGNQDFQVFRRGASEADWDWLADKQFAAVVTELTIDAGGTQVFTGTWDQVKLDGAMLEPGTYEAFGGFFPIHGRGPPLTEDDTRSPRVRFMVN